VHFSVFFFFRVLFCFVYQLKKKHQELKEYLLFLLLFSSEAEWAPPPPYPQNKGCSGMLEIYLAMTLPEAFDSSSSLKEKRKWNFYL